MKRNVFPFAAICGMEKAKEAILLTLVNPFAGGLLLSGEKGSGKSTLVRSARELVDAPWVEIPISVTEDRLFGSIDAEEAIRSGHKKLLPGLIDEADKGIIYMDDVNLLRDDLLSAVLNIREAGGYRLERDGLSEERKTAFTVLAVMNPDSGTLSWTGSAFLQRLTPPAMNRQDRKSSAGCWPLKRTASLSGPNGRKKRKP